MYTRDQDGGNDTETIPFISIDVWREICIGLMEVGKHVKRLASWSVHVNAFKATRRSVSIMYRKVNPMHFI